MNYSISVIIPNYNGKQLLEENIPHVFSALETSKISDFEIIISDDNSADDSVEFIKNKYPTIKVIENQTNKGFSGNTNIGIRAATKDLVLVLNTDVQLTNEYFVHQLPLFNEHDTFGVMGKIISLTSDKIQDGAKYPNYTFGDIKGTANYIHQDKTTLYTLFMSGANALIDRKKLLEIGCFQEIYNPYYSEDLDLGIRAWRLGYKIYFESRAVCRHPNSATIKKEPNHKVRVIAKRNKMYLHFIHLNNIECIYFLLKVSLKSLLRALLFDRHYLKSYYLFVGSLTKLQKVKNNFNQLQHSKNITLTLGQVINQIKLNIVPSEIQKF
jgi:GT2 family glycosyltransferase